MAEITSGWRKILSSPFVYRLFQTVMGGGKSQRWIVDQHICPKPGDRIIDIGCGPAEILQFMPDVEYVGYDISATYIEWAKRRYGMRGLFITAPFTGSELPKHEPFDIAVMVGVLHHLDDGEADMLLALLRRAVRPGGRVLAFDNVFIENQNPIARKLIEWDRGQNVRTPAGYQALATPHFESVRGEVIHQMFIPYTLWVMECR